ncbi:MAG: hypothetical protein JOY82_23470 [Streptosporangiaceae bacterium]|nr:hypothetical protein [Streptosporangiaceae bacterium]MBV9857443.1 hypothetical protein [Streptosporangiaceae bacterium]
MTLDHQLLDQARTAEARVIDAERDAEVARAEFHRAVRRLQLGGGSLREIANALGISHQRVHQIVEGAGGARRWRRRRGRPAATACCSFCGKSQPQISKLIAGPGVSICGECVDKADAVIATGEVAATPLSAMKSLSAEVTAARCSFCGKRRHQVSGLAAAAGGIICNECLVLCHEFQAEDLS